MIERQKDISDGKYSNLVVFPESFTTNNQSIAFFKRGAFESLLPVLPIVFVYSGYPEAPTMGCMSIADNAFFALFGNIWQKQTRYILPPFIPNDYFFEKYKDSGKEKSHLFAWAVRELMSKYSGLPLDDNITL